MKLFMKHVIVAAIHYLFSSAILVKHQNVFFCHKLIGRKLSFITITTYGTNSLSSQSDCCLYVVPREKLINNLGAFSFNLSLLYLFDVLFSGYFNTSYDEHLENKTVTSMECENIFTDHGRKTDNPIIK